MKKKKPLSAKAVNQKILSEMVRIADGLGRVEQTVQQRIEQVEKAQHALRKQMDAELERVQHQQRVIAEGRQLPGELVRTTIGIAQVEKAQHIFYKQIGEVIDGQSRIESMLTQMHLLVTKVIKLRKK